jgi:hypothetical protein
VKPDSRFFRVFGFRPTASRTLRSGFMVGHYRAPGHPAPQTPRDNCGHSSRCARDLVSDRRPILERSAARVRETRRASLHLGSLVSRSAHRPGGETRAARSGSDVLLALRHPGRRIREPRMSLLDERDPPPAVFLARPAQRLGGSRRSRDSRSRRSHRTRCSRDATVKGPSDEHPCASPARHALDEARAQDTVLALDSRSRMEVGDGRR